MKKSLLLAATFVTLSSVPTISQSAPAKNLHDMQCFIASSILASSNDPATREMGTEASIFFLENYLEKAQILIL